MEEEYGGVYILETQGPEYRVAYSSNIQDIYGEFNDLNIAWNPEPVNIKKTFGTSKIFKSKKEAENHANIIAKTYTYLEDGVCYIDDFSYLSYSALDKSQ